MSPTSSESVALDSNVLTYFIKSLELTDQTFREDDPMCLEQVATLRIYLYSGHPFFLPPTTRREYEQIADPKKLKLHVSTNSVLVDDIRDFDQTYEDLPALLSYN